MCIIDWHKVAFYKDGKLYWKINTFSGRYNDKPAAIAGREMGSIKPDGYWHFSYKKKWYLRHRIVWELHHGRIPEGFVVDHIVAVKKTVTADDRIENLQLLSKATNIRKGGGEGANITNNSSKRRGVSFDRKYILKPWRARMKIGGTQLCENFETEKEAVSKRSEWEGIYCQTTSG